MTIEQFFLQKEKASLFEVQLWKSVHKPLIGRHCTFEHANPPFDFSSEKMAEYETRLDLGRPKRI